MKICEYRSLMKGHHNKFVDEMERLHMLAWQTNLAGQSKKDGSPLFARFDKFFKREDWLVEDDVNQRNPEQIERWDESIKKAEELLNEINN